MQVFFAEIFDRTCRSATDRSVRCRRYDVLQLIFLMADAPSSAAFLSGRFGELSAPGAP
jgi:hypothetical protein